MRRHLLRLSRVASTAVLLGTAATAVPASAHAATPGASLAATAAGDVDVVGIVVSVFQLLGDIAGFVAAIVNAVI